MLKLVVQTVLALCTRRRVSLLNLCSCAEQWFLNTVMHVLVRSFTTTKKLVFNLSFDHSSTLSTPLIIKTINYLNI
jgi:hypothetical protein